MQVIKKPESGEKFVSYSIDGNILSLGDDEIMINLAKKERDDEVVIDIVRDLTQGLLMGLEGATYVAEIHIPPREYATEAAVGEDGKDTTKLAPIAFDPDKVTLYLFEEA